MSETHELSERLRARLLSAAMREEASVPPLSSDAERRIAAAWAREAPRAPVRAPRRHVLIASSLAAAAALAIALWPATEAPRAVRPEACGLPRDLTVVQRAGAGRVDLGALGDIVAEEGARLSVKASTPCALELAVAGGSVLVDVHKLAPARLVLTTPHGDVLVRGTQFALDVNRDGLDVHLVSGRVEVNDASQTFVLEAGHSLRHRHAGTTRTRDLADADRDELRRLMALRTVFVDEAAAAPTARADASVEAAPAATIASTSDYLARAESARRDGANDLARRLYQKATHGAPADAEVALLRWTRFELEQGRIGAARALLARHARAYTRGALAAEAAWLVLEVARQSGDEAGARRAAAELVRSFPGTPQADAAARWLGAP